MSKLLATAVHLTDESGVVHSFLPGTTPPKWARKIITNPKAWADDSDAADEDTETEGADDADETEESGSDNSGSSDGSSDGDESDESDADDSDAADEDTETGDQGGSSVPVPPKSGKGSGVAVWRAYADSHGFETDEDVTRDEIIAALNAGGIPTE